MNLPSPTSCFEVTVPCRLHFGLFSFGNPHQRQYGGVGAMVNGPPFVVRFSPGERFVVVGALSERVNEYVERWCSWHRQVQPPACAVEVISAPKIHVGLGVGTQLGLAVATGLNAIVGTRALSAVELADSVGRGQRSAVGTFGFLQGGLILEEGKLPGETLSPLGVRTPLPSQWRFVLITPDDHLGLFGKREQLAFQGLPPVPESVTAKLIRAAREKIVPAAQRQEFGMFSESVRLFGRLAGSCFKSVQGGPYNGPILHALVDRLVAAGYSGVGQSSWGPTIFVATSNQQEAESLVEHVGSWPELSDSQITIASVNNVGASLVRARSAVSDGGPQKA